MSLKKNNLIQKDKIFICKNQIDQISNTMVATEISWSIWWDGMLNNDSCKSGFVLSTCPCPSDRGWKRKQGGLGQRSSQWRAIDALWAQKEYQSNNEMKLWTSGHTFFPEKSHFCRLLKPDGLGRSLFVFIWNLRYTSWSTNTSSPERLTRSEEQMSSPHELRGTSEPTSEKNLWISTSQKALVLLNSWLLGYGNWPYSARLLDPI